MVSPAAARRPRLPSWVYVDFNDNDSNNNSNSGSGSPHRSTANGKATAKSSNNGSRNSPRNITSGGNRTNVQLKKPPPPSERGNSSPRGSPPHPSNKLAKTNWRGPTIPRESHLVYLCRIPDWPAALRHMQDHPEQAEPKLIWSHEQHFYHHDNCHHVCRQKGSHTITNSNGRNSTHVEPLYEETALHLVCALADFSKEDATEHLFQTLLQTCPKQAIVSHVNPGHTALRALLRNKSCTPSLLQCLLETMKQAWNDYPGQKGASSSQERFVQQCLQVDRDELRPLDHLLLLFHDPSRRQQNTQPLELLQILVEQVGRKLLQGSSPSAATPSTSPPLIRLLSLGNTNYNVRGSATAKHHHRDKSLPSNNEPGSSSHENDNILKATHYLLQNCPHVLHQVSLTTKCTPLHVAIRNYGNHVELMHCFLFGCCDSGGTALKQIEEHEDDDESSNPMISSNVLTTLRHRNQFGDLPLHVACSVGVPMSILRLVLQGTIQAGWLYGCERTKESTSSLVSSANSTCSCRNMCWTVNHAGYTPVDLEWIRHLEDGKGLFMARSFYPVEAGGMRKTFWKQDDFYRVLLEQAVQQAKGVQTNLQPARTLENPFWLGASRMSQLTNNGFASDSTNADATQANAVRSQVTSPNQTSQSTRAPRTQFFQYQSTTSPLKSHPKDLPTVEFLLHRIFLIIQSAATQRVPVSQIELTSHLLHAACQLSFPVAPSLPLPLLELILFMYPEQLLMPHLADNKDRSGSEASSLGDGNLPLHYAVQPQLAPASISQPDCFNKDDAQDIERFASDDDTSLDDKKQLCSDWETWVKQLVTHAPKACKSTNQSGQLPLHKALEPCCDDKRNCNVSKACNDTRKRKKKSKSLEISPREQSRLNVIRELVDRFPESVNVMDPVRRLMPFQLAAASPYMPLDAVFFLLRRSPDAVLA